MTESEHTPLPWKIDEYGDVVSDAKKDDDGLINGKYYDDIIAGVSYGDDAVVPNDDDMKLIVESVNNAARYREEMRRSRMAFLSMQYGTTGQMKDDIQSFIDGIDNALNDKEES